MSDVAHVPMLLHERVGEVLVMTINRPEARNALNREVTDAISAGYAALDESPELRVGILAGSGGYFCSGMDLKGFANGEYLDDSIVRDLPQKPMIAAIEGFALAGGLELALACDLIVAARGARLGIPEVKRGLVAAGGGVLRLPARVPYHVAMEMALTGEPLSAERGAELGLVNVLAEPGYARESAIELAAAIARNAPLAVTTSKRIVRAGRDWGEPQGWLEQSELIAPVVTSADAHEGAVAFAEKRLPRWVGR